MNSNMSDSDSDSDSESFVECMIAPIPESETRQIVAGQAVSDIASTVKELVDNALDAGSKAIKSKMYFDALSLPPFVSIYLMYVLGWIYVSSW